MFCRGWVMLFTVFIQGWSPVLCQIIEEVGRVISNHHIFKCSRSLPAFTLHPPLVLFGKSLIRQKFTSLWLCQKMPQVSEHHLHCDIRKFFQWTPSCTPRKCLQTAGCACLIYCINIIKCNSLPFKLHRWTLLSFTQLNSRTARPSCINA